MFMRLCSKGNPFRHSLSFVPLEIRGGLARRFGPQVP